MEGQVGKDEGIFNSNTSSQGSGYTCLIILKADCILEMPMPNNAQLKEICMRPIEVHLCVCLDYSYLPCSVYIHTHEAAAALRPSRQCCLPLVCQGYGQDFITLAPQQQHGLGKLHAGSSNSTVAGA
eukprot:scaffold322268_cov19-Tisochrysis_lutea.AAC.1